MIVEGSKQQAEELELSFTRLEDPLESFNRLVEYIAIIGTVWQ